MSSEPVTSEAKTPPSSPPALAENAKRPAMPSPTRKRSHDDMKGVEQADDEGSGFAAEPIDPFASQGKPSDTQNNSSHTILPSTPAHSMPPPQGTASSMMLPPSQKPPRSAQRVRPSQRSESREAKADNRVVPVVALAVYEEDESDPSPIEDDPQEPIEDFHWDHLAKRYHDQMDRFGADERAILAEFSSLCQYFGVWADATSSHEVERSFKRLRTHVAYVRHEEDQLEQKRGHYVKVMDAFRSALDLLSN